MRRILFILTLVFIWCLFYWRVQVVYAPTLVRMSTKPPIIAHAGGQYKGRNYSNSQEAVASTIASGVRLIELDLRKTSDKHLVALHEWSDVLPSAPSVHLDNTFPLEWYQSQQWVDSVHPMTDQNIKDLMQKRQDIMLVTDKCQDLMAIKSLSDDPSRVIAEVFDTITYVSAILSGKVTPALALWEGTFGLIPSVAKALLLQPRLVTVHVTTWQSHHQTLIMLTRLTGARLMVYTVNDEDMAQKILQEGNLIYSDNCIPNQSINSHRPSCPVTQLVY